MKIEEFIEKYKIQEELSHVTQYASITFGNVDRSQILENHYDNVKSTFYLFDHDDETILRSSSIEGLYNQIEDRFGISKDDFKNYQHQEIIKRLQHAFDMWN